MTLKKQASKHFVPVFHDLLQEPIWISEPLEGPQSTNFCQRKQNRVVRELKTRVYLPMAGKYGMKNQKHFWDWNKERERVLPTHFTAALLKDSF